MRVVHPSVYMKQREREKRRFKKRRVWYLFIVLVFTVYGACVFLVKPVYTPLLREVAIEHQSVQIAWPQVGTASIGSDQTIRSILADSGGHKAVPSASTIKLLTALVVLDQKPLGPLEQGEPIYFGRQDVDRYNDTVAKGGAALLIAQDTTITYREALEAMLVGSANNIADKLAIWAYGSVDAYVAAATTFATHLTLENTKITDASGLLATTVTSANDMVKIADSAMKSPTIASIVNMPKITLSDGRILTNTNTLLGKEEILGLKTGNTEEAGFCLVASKGIQVFGRKRIIYAVVFGQPSHEVADQAAIDLLTVTEKNFEESHIANKKLGISSYQAPWGALVDVVPENDINVLKWKGESMSAILDLKPLKDSAKAGDVVGSLVISGEKFDLVLGSDLPKPTLTWRMTHAVDFITQKL